MNIQHFCSFRALAVLLATILLSGCAARVPYPADWEPMTSSEAGCQDLSGRFRNQPDITSHEEGGANGLPLTEIFFGGLLDGFEVTHLEFESLADGGLRVTPWVGETRLREARIVAADEASCEDDGWVFTTGWDVDGLMIADAIFWTAGILVPAAEKWSFGFGSDAQGRLVVHAVARLGGTVLLIVPFSSRHHEAWFSYAQDLPEAHDRVE
jgi:hypothetical protein